MFDQNEIRFGYTLGRIVFQFHKIWMGDDVIMTSFKFSSNNCPYVKFHWTDKLRTWNEYDMIKMKVTLKDDEGHRCRSNVTKMN